MNNKIVLIDGHSLLNRAFYGVPLLTNAKGVHTNAVYGFLNMMFHFLDEEKPQYLMVAFDRKAPTFRHKIYDAYKGTRKPMPAELHEQVPILQDVLKAMGIYLYAQDGLEADDILGTMAKRSETAGLEVKLISGDRDLLQIASDHTCIRIPKTKGSGTEVENYYAKDVQEKYGVTPAQFIELKALMGDTADNIPGVPKVGEKTAMSLMAEYGSIESIYAHVEEITKKAIRESLIANRELADLSKELATIKTDCELPFAVEDTKLGELFTQEAYDWFKELEFKQLLNRFVHKTKEKELTGDFRLITQKEDAEQIIDTYLEKPMVGFFLLLDRQSQRPAGEKVFPLKGIALCAEKEKVDVFTTAEDLSDADLAGMLLTLQKRTKLTGFALKEAYFYLDQAEDAQKEAGLPADECKERRKLEDKIRGLFDLQIAAYLLNPLKNDYEIEDVSSEYLGVSMRGYKECFGKNEFLKALDEGSQDLIAYAGYGALTCFKARDMLSDKLKESGMDTLFTDMEMPLSYVLYAMEKEGIRVEAEALKRYGEALSSRIEELEKSIHELAGEEFNINSPKQLGVILFEKMGITGGKKTKTGYSTAADLLEKLAPQNPIINSILEYRGLTKLKSTYADGLGAYIGEDHKIHTSFNQTITATGRISSNDPNLQNIPMRTDLGRKIRKVFVPETGDVFTDADYSQIELRILAHMSGDEQLIEAYQMDEDIHRITASKVFKTPLEEVTPLQRRNAKAVNFGIVYGISSFGLSQDLSISRKEAEGYINEYFATYPGIKAFLDGMVEQAKENGYITTLYGRRRPIPELKSGNFMQRSFGERVAMNSPIQGTAADIMKIAMINVYRALEDRGLKSKLILQIHDELVIETKKEEEEEVATLLRENMKHAAKLKVELEVDLHTGTDWYEAK